MLKTEPIRYQHAGNLPVLAQIPPQVKTILDLGCGEGDNARLLQAAGKILDGITFSEREAQGVASFYRQVWIHNLESGLPEAVLNQKYDLVLCSHLLEHLCQPEALFKDLRQLLAQGGELLVALPNLMHYKTRWPLIWGRFEYTELGVMDQTHYRWYTFASAQALLIQNGFQILEASAEISLPPSRITRHFPLFLQTGLKKFLFKLSPGLFGFQLIYRAKPSPTIDPKIRFD